MPRIYTTLKVNTHKGKNKLLTEKWKVSGLKSIYKIKFFININLNPKTIERSKHCLVLIKKIIDIKILTA